MKSLEVMWKPCHSVLDCPREIYNENAPWDK